MTAQVEAQADDAQKDSSQARSLNQQLLYPAQANRKASIITSRVRFKQTNPRDQTSSSRDIKSTKWNSIPQNEVYLQDRSQQFEAIKRESSADQIGDTNLAPLDLASINERTGKSTLAERNFKPPLMKHPNPWLLQGPLTRVDNHKYKLIDLAGQNCITRATHGAWACEDNLIKRLNQDAGEGRTVVDVGRRVCCALFWHKDCINRVIVQTCPDSSPAAADFLMGSRKVDLTLSCQRFNRDGCNSGRSLFEHNKILALTALIISLIVTSVSSLHYV